MTLDTEAPPEPPRRRVGITCRKCGHFREGMAGATPRMVCPNCGAVYAKVQEALDAVPRQPSLRPRPPMPTRQLWAAAVMGVMTLLALVNLFSGHTDQHWIQRLITLVMMGGAFVGLMLSRPGDQRSPDAQRRFFAMPQPRGMRRARLPGKKVLLAGVALYGAGIAVLFGLLWLAGQIYGR